MKRKYILDNKEFVENDVGEVRLDEPLEESSFKVKQKYYDTNLCQEKQDKNIRHEEN